MINSTIVVLGENLSRNEFVTYVKPEIIKLGFSVSNISVIIKNFDKKVVVALNHPNYSEKEFEYALRRAAYKMHEAYLSNSFKEINGRKIKTEAAHLMDIAPGATILLELQNAFPYCEIIGEYEDEKMASEIYPAVLAGYVGFVRKRSYRRKSKKQ